MFGSFGFFGFFDIAGYMGFWTLARGSGPDLALALPRAVGPAWLYQKNQTNQKNQTFLIYPRGLIALLRPGWLANHKENPT